MHAADDYCNALFAGFPASQLSVLQSVLKAAARFVLGLLDKLFSVTADAQLITLAQQSTSSDIGSYTSACKDLRWCTLPG